MSRFSKAGNAIMEYALPVAVVLVICGVVATVGDIQKLLAGFFASASGHTQADIKNGTLEVKTNATIQAPTGNGSAGFKNFGGVSDGDGNSVGAGGRPSETAGEQSDAGSNYWEPEEP